MAEFIGEVKTLWQSNHRDMKLLEAFSFIDPAGKEWKVPVGSFLNGATIPRALWSIVGSPYTGSYRRATVIHDYFVGEGTNPEVSHAERRSADKMFYHACRSDGCTRSQAVVLYMGVSVGSFFAKRHSREALFEPDLDNVHETPLDQEIKAEFYKVYYSLEADHQIEKMASLKYRSPMVVQSDTEFIEIAEAKVDLLLL